MLYFKIKPNPNPKYSAVEIGCDREGMAILMGALAELVGEGASHRHLRSPAGGGKELDETTPWGEETGISEVIITYAEGC
jgi:hypothetical protein